MTIWMADGSSGSLEVSGFGPTSYLKDYLIKPIFIYTLLIVEL
ncbi:MAG: hypothetical protein RIM72_03030 [Alphaproteobacteria bacterium]